jgi:predicted NAD/FAD-binding protein
MKWLRSATEQAQHRRLGYGSRRAVGWKTSRMFPRRVPLHTEGNCLKEVQGEAKTSLTSLPKSRQLSA